MRKYILPLASILWVIPLLMACSADKYGDSNDYSLKLQNIYFSQDPDQSAVIEEVRLDTIHVVNNTDKDQEFTISLVREDDNPSSSSIFKMDKDNKFLDQIIYDSTRKFSIPASAEELTDQPTIPYSGYSSYLSVTDHTVFTGDKFVRTYEVAAHSRLILERKGLYIRLPAVYKMVLTDIWTQELFNVFGEWNGVLLKDMTVEEREEAL